MANKSLFQSAQYCAPKTDTINKAGGKAYKLSPKQALAQIAMTNCFNATFYTSGKDLLSMAKKVALDCKDPEYLAKVAIASREKGYMKDMPAFLTVLLAEYDTTLFRRVFRRVINNGKMLRNVIQMARSGQVGRVRNMSSGTYRHAIQEWFDGKSPMAIWKASIGNDPSMRDILRMARPKPNSEAKAALYAYLKGTSLEDGVYAYRRGDGNEVVCTHKYEHLPEQIRQYEAYKETRSGKVPSVDYRFLDSLGLDQAGWIEVAKNAGWQMTFKNLNTFARHGVFDNKEAVQIVANRLRDEEAFGQSGTFPYQVMTAWIAAGRNVPFEIQEALQDAMEMATANVPAIGGKVYICVDVSGSMGGVITGNRGSASSVVTCVDVAALFAASMLRANRNSEVLCFSRKLHDPLVNARDTVLTNAERIRRALGGGTNCSLPIAYLNQQKAKGDVIVFVSDYESWIDSGPGYRYSDGTVMHKEWLQFKKRNKGAKLICIDVTPRDNGQVVERPDILQVGGFSDQVFEVIAGFVESGYDSNHWVNTIDQIEI